jgi:hypothetical protein
MTAASDAPATTEALDAPVAAQGCSKCDSKKVAHGNHGMQDARRYGGNTVAPPMVPLMATLEFVMSREMHDGHEPRAQIARRL